MSIMIIPAFAFIILFLLNAPIGLGALLVSSVSYLLLSGIDLTIATQAIVGGMDSFVLLAIPLYILAAELMNSTGVAKRLFSFANSIVGRIPGGLAQANVLLSMLFAGMSGSAAADAAGLGLMEIEAMHDQGYDKPFSAAVTAASSTIGPIIPPSIPMVIYGTIAQVSVGRLFLGGLIPGILMGLSMMGVCYVRAIQRDYPKSPPITLKEFFSSLKEAISGLLAPAILLGGIYTGVFTPTEAAAVCAVYALILGVVVYRDITWKDLKRIALNTVVNTATVLLIIGIANLFGWILTRERIPTMLTARLLSISDNRFVMLAIFNALFLILGCFMEINAIMLIFLPMLLPLLNQMGIDLVHFGVVMVLNLMLGTLTPPFGMGMYIVTGITKAPMHEVIKELWPFIGMLIIVLVIITYVPQLVLWLPNLMVR